MKTSSHWRHMYNKENKLFICVNINIFRYLGAGGGGGGASSFTSTLSSIINVHVKYRSNLIRTFFRGKMKNMKILFNFFRGHVGPLHKLQGHLYVSKCRPPHHNGDNNGKQFENLFFIHGPKCKQNVYFGLFREPEGVFNDMTGLILLSSYPLTHIYVHVK